MQSVFLILAMLGLLYILLKYRKESPPSTRPFAFWQWSAKLDLFPFLAPNARLNL
jgi:hypothetical protein